MNNNQYVLFKLDNHEFAIDINKVRTIERVTSITRVPGALDFVKGVINLRGEVIPVVDIRKRLELQQKEMDDETRIIIVKVEDLEIGMVVDEAYEVVTIEEEDIDKNIYNSKEIDEKLVKGVGRIADRIVVILDIRSLLKID